MCVVGTETAVDHSKPIASYVHGMLGLPAQCRVFETKHACFRATAALLGATEWIASGAARGRVALVIATDIARYELESAGEPTQGAGAVAMLISEDPRLVELEVGETGWYARNVHDFWRPLHRKDALVDGHFSVECYLDALEGAYSDWKTSARAPEPSTLVRSCYHVPYGKMASKAHRRRLAVEGASQEEADARFAKEVAASLGFSARIATCTPPPSTSRSPRSSPRRRPSSRAHVWGSSATAPGVARSSSPAVWCPARGLLRGISIWPLRSRTADGSRWTEYVALRRADADANRRAIAADRPSGIDVTGGQLGADAPSGEHRRVADEHAVFLGVDDAERRMYRDQPRGSSRGGRGRRARRPGGLNRRRVAGLRRS